MIVRFRRMNHQPNSAMFSLLSCFLSGTAGALLLAGLLIVVNEAGAEEHVSRQLRAHHPDAGALSPQLPAGDEFPVQLVLDDGSAELDFGLVGANSVPFMWLNRFDVDEPFWLEEIWVLFPQNPALEDAAIELVVFQDTNDDPRDGAQLHRASSALVLATDGVTFSIYPLEQPVEVTAPHLYLGVISRYAEMSTPPSFPAALDIDGAGGRSWVAVWLDDPPIPPQLPGDDETFLIDDLIPGHWMIRGFGRPLESPPPFEIPVLGRTELTLFATWLAIAALVLLRRRPRRSSQISGRAAK